MRKVVIEGPGGYDRLRVVRENDVSPAKNQVAIDVEAAGVNYADCVVRMGLYESAKKYVGWPITPGFEVAGRVASIGDGCEGLVVGEPVIAVTRFGAYASRVVVPREQVFPRPFAHDTSASACFAAVSLTAYYALYELANAKAGHTVLVHSAAGGVGSALLQLARGLRCRSVAVVGARHKRDLALKMGADVVIDKSAERWERAAREAAPDGYDAVFDANGHATLRKSYALLRSPGRLVVYGFHSMLPRSGGRADWARLFGGWLQMPRFSPLKLTGENRAVMGFNLSYLFENAPLLDGAMRALLTLAQEGALAPPPVRTYALEDVAEAHRALESGRTTGKLALTM